MKFLVINGPNLNLLGKREPEYYGALSLPEINEKIKQWAKENSCETVCIQTNSEEELINSIHDADDSFSGIVINPAAFTHYSFAVMDALRAISIPVVEVHISNIYRREGFRTKSVTASAATGVISGFGYYSYILGLEALYKLCEETSKNE